MDTSDFLLLNALGDADSLFDIMSDTNSDRNKKEEHEIRDSGGSGQGRRLDPLWDRVTPGEARGRIAKRGHCSALIKASGCLL